MNGKSFVGLICISAILLAPSLPARAEIVKTNADLPNSKRTNAYINSKDTYQTLLTLGAEQDRKFGIETGCRSDYHILILSASVIQPVDFPDDKPNPVKGIWNVRYQMTRCSVSKIYSALFVASSNGETPKSRAYVPGSPLGNLVLIQNAMPMVQTSLALRSGNAACKDTALFDIEVSEPPHELPAEGKTIKRVWKEIWTFKWCDQIIDTEVTFLPGASDGGTDFQVDSFNSAWETVGPPPKPSEIRELNQSMAAILAEQRRGGEANRSTSSSDPNLSAGILIKRGIEELAKNDFPQAANDFERVPSKDPKFGEAKMWTAISQQIQNDLTGAASSYQSALSAVDPNSAVAATIMELYSALLSKQGQQNESAQMQKRASDIRATLAAQITSRNKSSQPDVYSIGNGVIAPTLLNNVPPEYTPEARLAHYTGKVTLALEIDADGLPRHIRVVQGLGFGLSEKAFQAVSRWRFRPGTKEGLPVRTKVAVVVEFRTADNPVPAEKRTTEQFSNAPPVATGVGTQSAAASAPLAQAKDLLKAKRFSEALTLFEQSANGGNTEAQRYLGDIYRNGLGTNKDYGQARQWYALSAAGGNPVAMGSIGFLYEHGLGVAQDYSQALQWYEKAAAAGDPAGTNNLGFLYLSGKGVALDYAKAHELFEKAAASGNSNAMNNLGIMYQSGRGVALDYTKAREWFEKSAASGNPNAMNNLGYLFERGQGVTQNYAQARLWYEKALAAGFAPAKTSLEKLPK